MDWIKIVYSFILLVFGVLIFVASFPKNGDERRKFINGKAQSYSFIVVVGMLILEVLESIYLAIKGDAPFNNNGFSPISFLSVISIIYLITLLIYRKKYGD